MFERVDPVADGRVVSKLVEQRFGHLRPHPRARLLRPPRVELTGSPRGRDERAHRFPQLLDAFAEQRRARAHTVDRTVVGRAHEMERVRVVGRRVPRQVGQLAVGLVDDDEVGELDDAALHSLQLVARARSEEQHEQVDHAGHRNLRLADSNGLDEHDVEAGGLTHQERFTRAPRHAPERSPRRRRADERLGSPRELLHARLVAEDRPAAAHARRVDREHRNAMPRIHEVQAERFDERRLPRARRAADAHAGRGAGGGQDRVEQGHGIGAMVGAGRLHERDRPRQCPPVAGAHGAGEVDRFRHRLPAQALARRSRTNARISEAARQMLLPGPKIALTPASCRKS